MPTPGPDTDPTQGADTARSVAIAAAGGLDDARCEDIIIIDVRRLSQVTDYIVIGSGASDRQMRTAASKAEESVETLGVETFRSSRDPSSTWVVLDFVDVVVHIFEPTTRAHYDLEMLWGDGPRIEWTPAPRRGGSDPMPDDRPR